MITLFEQILKLSNNDYLYHIITDLSNIDLLKKYGLCSPFSLYEKDKELFKKYSFNIYKERTAKFLNKKTDNVTLDDILIFLDNPSRYPLTSKSIFFSLMPFNQLPLKTQTQIGKHVELKINVKYLKKHNPIIIDKQEKIESTWGHIMSPDFLKKVKFNMKPSDYLIYRNILHIAINCTNIPYSLIEENI